MNTYHNLYDFPLFAGCSRQCVDDLIKNASNRLSVYKPGDLIAMQGKSCRSLYLLMEGTVTTFMTSEEGKELTIERMQAPQILAPAFIYGSESHFPVSVKAIDGCKLWIVSKDSFFVCMQQNEMLLRNFLRVISDRSLFLSKKLNEFALQSLRDRVVGYLKRYQSIQNIQETAFILGVARPSLSRALALLVAEGTVVKDDSGYVLA